MTKRKGLSKTTRFEVFKRDKFTCQYCGAKAPDVILHADHINPVANGGDNAIMNLVTACADCNSGKGARMLDDRSAVERQRAQIEEAQGRREQLEMMLKWRDDEQAAKSDVVAAISARLGERGGYEANESGRQTIRRWMKRFSAQEVLEALDEAFDTYMKFNGDEPDLEAWGVAFQKIPAIANLRREAKERPHVVKVAYIQAILRRRFRDPRGNYFQALEDLLVDRRITPEALQELAQSAPSWDALCEAISQGEKRAERDFFSEQLREQEVEYALEIQRDRQREADREADREELDDGYDDDGYDNDGAD